MTEAINKQKALMTRKYTYISNLPLYFFPALHTNPKNNATKTRTLENTTN